LDVSGAVVDYSSESVSRRYQLVSALG
jgi:hypothetical protein